MKADALLALLAGCPCGATEPMLERLGAASAALRKLHRAELVSARIERFVNPPGLVVTRYAITDKGRAAIRRDTQ
jgi:hypothetical protein